MKKSFLAILVTICMLFTMMPMAVSADSENIIDFFVENNVDPAIFGMLLMSTMAPSDGTSDAYVLRSLEDLDDIAYEISTMASEYGEMDIEILKEYVLSFMDYFGFRDPAEAEMFIKYLNSTRSTVLPIGIQDTADIMFPSIKDVINTEFFSMTVFMNILNDLNTVYCDNYDNVPMMYYSGGRIRIRNNADSVCSYSGNILIRENEELVRFYFEKIVSSLSLIEDCPEYDVSGFADYLLSCGILSYANSEAAEVDEEINETYEAYYYECAQGNDSIGAFTEPEMIRDEYLDLLINADGGEFNDLLREALSKAAEITVKESATSAPLSNNNFLFFAVLNALKTCNLLIEGGAPVPSDFEYDIKVIFENRSSRNYSISLPSDAFTYSNTSQVDGFIFDTGMAKLSVKGKIALAGSVIARGLTSIIISEQSAGTLLVNSGVTEKAVSVKLLNGANEINGNVSGNTALLTVPFGGNTNYMYGIKSSGDCDLVNDFEFDGENSSFEMGEYRAFAYIDGGYTVEDNTDNNTDDNNDNNDDDNNNNNNNNNNNDNTNNNNSGNGTSFVDGTENTEGENNTDTGEEDKNETENKPSEKPENKPGHEIVAEVSFVDVTDGHWANEYIYRLAGYGIINGMGNDMFMPENNITREQFAKILVESFNLMDETATTDFSDVEENAWYAPYVASAQKKGIINGVGNGAFGVGENITRQDMAVMITRAVEAADIKLVSIGGAPAFSDLEDIADYARISVRILNSAQIINGYEDNTFRPKAFATRAQASKIISMLIDLE